MGLTPAKGLVAHVADRVHSELNGKRFNIQRAFRVWSAMRVLELIEENSQSGASKSLDLVVTSPCIFEPVDQSDAEGTCQFTVKVMLVELNLVKVRDLVVSADGSYAFTGTHHTSYRWERNYNAGTQTEHIYTVYRVTVARDKSATYEVLEAQH